MGIQSADLDPNDWSTIKFDELSQDDDWVDEPWIDVAVQRLKSGLYSDQVVGRSIRAIRSDQFLTFRRDLYSDVAPIGMPTLTVGLLQFVPGDPMRLEPMAHFGRLAMVPVGTVEGSWGQMAAYLVGSSASQGMSGAHVFAQLENGEYRLLGIHVGHFKERHDTHDATIMAPVGRRGLPLRAPLFPKVMGRRGRRRVKRRHCAGITLSRLGK